LYSGLKLIAIPSNTARLKEINYCLEILTDIIGCVVVTCGKKRTTF